jgi:hypothetical protein
VPTSSETRRRSASTVPRGHSSPPLSSTSSLRQCPRRPLGTDASPAHPPPVLLCALTTASSHSRRPPLPAPSRSRSPAAAKITTSPPRPPKATTPHHGLNKARTQSTQRRPRTSQPYLPSLKSSREPYWWRKEEWGARSNPIQPSPLAAAAAAL